MSHDAQQVQPLPRLPTECGCRKVTKPLGMQAWGRCSSAWIESGGYCRKTCGRCAAAAPSEGGLGVKSAPSTLAPAPAPAALPEGPVPATPAPALPRQR